MVDRLAEANYPDGTLSERSRWHRLLYRMTATRGLRYPTIDFVAVDRHQREEFRSFVDGRIAARSNQSD
jgi:hypothetical protein